MAMAPLPCRACWRTVPYMEGLSRETLAVIGAATALAGLILRQGSRIDKRFEQIEERLTSVERETSRIGGLLEGLGLSGRMKSAPSGDAG